MKTMFLAAALAFFAASSVAQDRHGHAHEPRHGGVVSEYKGMEMELVARPDVVQLYLRAHKGGVLDVSRASAKVTLLTGTEKQEIELKPAGDRLEARGRFKVGKGTKAVAVVKGVGRGDATARFSLK